ncbi:MAG: hypothetical protein HZB13_04575 [Acidobacteria bacterium]|nr:hypothetical protein [Acidobacteriota bacterium]
MRRLWTVLLALTASGAEKVDYGWAFAPPHRITLGKPGGSVKTLLDAEPGFVTIAWTYDDLRAVPLGAWKAPRIQWRVRVGTLVDGEVVRESTWARPAEGWPVLDMTFRSAGGNVQLGMAGSDAGAVGRLTIRNTDSRPHRFAVRCEVQGGWVAHNPAWIDAGRDGGALLAMQFDRADRVLLLLAGGRTGAPAKKSISMEWDVAPGAIAQGWLVRPQEAYERDLPAMRARDWNREYASALAAWREVLAAAERFEIPDEGVARAFRASLADLFIMREPLAQGYTGTIAGTDLYRSANPFEPSLTAIALGQVGLHAAAAEGMRVHLDMQAADGNWNDPQGWAHDMWGAAGMKAWAATAHWRLTGDREYLRAVYPRLLASSRWQAAQRKRGGTSGLMPRGMGDGGLMNGDDYFGVFYPHNFLAVMADRLAAEAAEALGRSAEAAELKGYHVAALADLRRSLEKGAIREGGISWIPGSPGNTSGSRWGALYALFPAKILEPRNPLIEGTLKRMEASLSAGGQPVHTGWMADGTWPAITLDNLAEAHLVRGEGDAAAAYLYSTLNHATPLVTWCEERGLEPGSTKTAGDRQHLWTPLAVVRVIRDSLVMEQGGELHLALGTARSWLSPGRSVGVKKAPTHFGEVSYRISATPTGLRAEIDPPARTVPKAMVLHLRQAERKTPRAVRVDGQVVRFDAACECVRLPAGRGKMVVEALY